FEPPEDNSSFNIFLIHQNHNTHGPSAKYIPESFLPQFLDLVLWGHEHDCYPDPVENAEHGFSVIQPGSSVATQLTYGEARTKYAVLMDIKNKNFTVNKILLETVRPLCVRDIFLETIGLQPNESKLKQKIIEHCEQEVESSLSKIKEENPGSKMPLIRLRVFYDERHETFSSIVFGQKFVNKIANHSEIVVFTKAGTKNQNNNNKFDKNDNTADFKYHNLVENENSTTRNDFIYSLIKEFVPKYGGLDILSCKMLCDSLSEFVDKDDTHSIIESIKNQNEKVAEKLRIEFQCLSNNSDDNEMDYAFMKFINKIKSKIDLNASNFDDSFTIDNKNCESDPEISETCNYISIYFYFINRIIIFAK
ncbi:MAG: Double-strand break repair protein mre11a, partial [Paramarteilia canceri]